MRIRLSAVEEGSTLRDTVDQEVMGLMGRLVSNEQDIIPLGVLGLPLRARYEPRQANDAANRIVARVEEIRAASGGQTPAPATQPPPATPPAPPADSAETGP